MNITTNEKDIYVMTLIHYFMTKKGYSPIIIRGIENEIWLENTKEEFRIVRIITKSIYNDEQYDFDKFKMKNILSQIKKRTLNPFMDVLTIYIEVGDNFKADIKSDKNYKYVVAATKEEFINNELIEKYYNDYKDYKEYEEDGFALLGKITSDISKKNLEENVRYNEMFKPKKPIVTYIIIAINVILYVIMYRSNLTGDINNLDDTLIKYGAIVGDLVRGGDYYRLITSAFIHIGIYHLLANMYSLFILGPNVEHFYGRGKYLCIYLYSAIMGSLFTMVFQGASISAGASGAIFGLLGALLYFGYNYRGYLGNRLINQLLPVVIINLAISFLVPGISAAAHIGGLIGGVAVSFMLGANVNDNNQKQIHGLIITLLLTAFMVYLAFFR